MNKTINTKYFHRSIPYYVILLVLLASCQKEEFVKTINANSDRATIIVDGEVRSNWIISPQINLDIFGVVIENGNISNVTFKTDIDSVTYKIGAGENKDFIVVLNEKDSAFTSLQAVPPRALFTDKYVDEHRGKWSV